jgi:2-dehydropantoate 2-reductase
VAAAIGVHLPYTDPVSVVESVAERTAYNKSSMLKDVLRGSPTEIDAINGAIVTIGEKENVPVQLNRTLWLLINAIDRTENFQGKNSIANEKVFQPEFAAARWQG